MDQDADQLFECAQAGDPAPLAQAFCERSKLRVPLMRLLLATQTDAPVAAAQALIWQEAGPDLAEPLHGLLGWYLRDEARTRHPLRAACHREILLRVLSQDGLPRTESGFDLGFTAVRVLTGLPVPLALHAQAARALDRLARAWFARPAAAPRPALIYAALGTMDLPLIRRCIDAAGTEPRPPELRRAIEWGLRELMDSQGSPDDWLLAAIETSFRLDPESPGSVHGKIWLAMLQDQPFSTVSPLLRRMRLDPAEPQLKPVLVFAHDKARQQEADQELPWLDAQLRTLDPDWSFDAGRAEVDPVVPTRTGTARGLEDLIAQARALAATDLGLGAAVSPAMLEEAFSRLVAATERARVPKDWTLGKVISAAAAISQLTTREFGWVVHFVDAPHAGGRAEYGTVDLDFFPVLHRGLLNVSAAICRAGLHWIEAGHGAAGGWALARLMKCHTDAALEADAIGAAHGFLDRLEAAGVLPAVLVVERDNTFLRAGQIAAAEAAPPLARKGSTVHPFLSRADWSRAEGLHWDALARDPVLHGRFDILWPDGSLLSYAHETPARDVLVAPAGAMSLVSESLLIGPNGAMLKPDPYHTSLNYPIESQTVLAGQGKAVRIRPAATGTHPGPVLLLDGLSALHWPNYYHWMITHLSRIALAAEAGLLDQRKVVLPEGLKSWKLESLDLIGVPEDARLVVPPSHLIRYSDALILSSVEHLSPAAIQALRRRLLGAAAQVTAPPATGRAFYLSRRSRALRKLDNEQEIEAIASEMGFEVIAPEDYSIDQQRALFAQARGIAAPEGAALSNMIFAAPGTRVLSILCQNDMLPIFNDLALVLGQAHCKLPGIGLEGMPDSTRFQPHYRIDPGLARRALAWVLDGTR